MNNRKLSRSQNERMIGGVCGGIANYMDLDPTIVRLVFLILLLMGGNGFLIYIILLIIMPLETTGISGSITPPDSSNPENN
jgi:phage shock protein C